jgi:hypothetical protein
MRFKGSAVPALFVFAFVLPWPAAAAGKGRKEPAGWAAVQALRVGTRLVVSVRKGLSRETCKRFGQDPFLIRDGRVMEVQREEVTSIEKVTGKGPGAAAATGAGIGFAAGLLVAFLLNGAGAGAEDGDPGPGLIGCSLVGGYGAGVGALVGWIAGSKQKRITIYEAPEPDHSGPPFHASLTPKDIQALAVLKPEDAR